MKKIVALLTDFGTEDHFAATMKAVMLSLDPQLRIFDISHRISPQNILEAAYTLSDTLPYWPRNTVFVAVVDPGVGTERRSIAACLHSGHMVICPDNGLLTLFEESGSIKTIRQINEKYHRLPGSDAYHTFHGRDIYAYVAGKIAAEIVEFKDLGSELKERIVTLDRVYPGEKNGVLSGAVVKVERPFGNLCTNIDGHYLSERAIRYGDTLGIRLYDKGKLKHELELKFMKTFGSTKPGDTLAYLDSSGRLGLSINQGNFSEKFNIGRDLPAEIQVFRS